MVIDAHVHVWPDAIAARALARPAEDLVRYGDGRVATALATMDAAGIDRAVALGVANRAAQVESANAFVGGLDRDRFIPFGTIHPDLDPEENVASLQRHAIRGVKLHPLFQSYALDDARLWAVLEAMEDRWPAIVHVGAGGASVHGGSCTPAMLRAVARRFPNLRLIACHFGGYRMLDEAEHHVIGAPVHVDTSWPPSAGAIGAERLRELIDRHGADRVIFATDWPMADPAAELAVIRGLGLPDAQLAGILGGNLSRLLAPAADDPR